MERSGLRAFDIELIIVGVLPVSASSRVVQSIGERTGAGGGEISAGGIELDGSSGVTHRFGMALDLTPDLRRQPSEIGLQARPIQRVRLKSDDAGKSRTLPARQGTDRIAVEGAAIDEDFIRPELEQRRKVMLPGARDALTRRSAGEAGRRLGTCTRRARHRP